MLGLLLGGAIATAAGVEASYWSSRSSGREAARAAQRDAYREALRVCSMIGKWAERALPLIAPADQPQYPDRRGSWRGSKLGW